jgi:excinuclease ABC subunit A
MSVGSKHACPTAARRPRIKLASEQQRPRRGHTLYVLDEPTTGLHPADVDALDAQLHRLVESGNTVVVGEHDMRMVAGSDWGTPQKVSQAKGSRTAPYLAATLTSRRRSCRS